MGGYRHATWHVVIGVTLGCLLVLSPLAVRGADSVRVGPAPPARPAAKLGRTAAAQPLSVSLPLVTDKAAIDAFIARLYDPKSPDYHHYLTPRQFTDRFVDPAARGAVTGYLTAQGLRVTSGDTGSLVTAEGTAAQMERAFGVVLSDYRAADGRVFYAADQAAALPAAVASRVHGVEGLETAEQDHPDILPGPAISAPAPMSDEPRLPYGCDSATSLANKYKAFTPNQLAAAYGLGALNARGQGQTMALFEEDDYVASNISIDLGCYYASVTPPLTRIVNGAAPSLGSGETEVELDIEIALNMAPGLAKLLVYETANDTSNATALYQRIANDNLAQTVSTSWGNCEYNRSSTTLQARYTIFQQMATQGMSMFASAGDSGSQGCSGNTAVLSVEEPASQPYVTGVGGTNLVLGTFDTVTSETVWNETATGNGATGGGVSSYFSRPSYQDGFNGNAMRGVPDIAADADPLTGYVIYTQGQWAIYGGTSASAPLWATATALINQYLLARAAPRIGFANATFYGLYARIPGAFRDITSGNNCYQGPTCGTPNAGQYPAGPGYDLTTGLGSLSAIAIARNLTPPATITSLTPNHGSTSGGYDVQINGTNFRSGAGVSFGPILANAQVINASTIIFTMPAMSPGPAAVTVTNPYETPVTLNSAFTFVAPPSITSLDVTHGVNVGNTVITISGAYFQPGATVAFGDASAANVTVVNASTITLRTAPGSVGPVTVIVTNPDGQTGSLVNGFTYTGPVITGTLPATASTSGGALYTITGTGFQPGVAVAFSGDGIAYGASVQVNGAGTQITLTLPQHRQGLADMTVVNPDGSDATRSTAIQFIGHTEGTVSGTTPAAEPVGGHMAAPTAAAMPAPQPARH